MRNRLEAAAQKAREINAEQNLSLIEGDLRDEIFQGSSPVLVGIDAEPLPIAIFSRWPSIETAIHGGVMS